MINATLIGDSIAHFVYLRSPDAGNQYGIDVIKFKI